MREGLSRKDELYNSLLKLLKENNQAFVNEVDGQYIVQVIFDNFINVLFKAVHSKTDFWKIDCIRVTCESSE